MPEQYENDINKKNWTRVLFIFFFSYSAMNGFVIAIIQRIPVFGVAAPMFLPVVTVCLLLLSIREGSFRYCRRFDLVFFAIVVVLILLSGVPDISRLSSFIFQVLPAYYIGVNYVDDDKTVDWLEYCAAFSIVTNTIYFMQIFSRLGVRYDMARAYSILPHVLIVINAIYRNQKQLMKVVYILCSIVGALYISMLGSRGPLAIIFIYFIVNTFAKSKGNFKIKIFFLLLLTTIGIAWISGGYLIIVQKLMDILSGLGLPTRSIGLLLSGEFVSHTSGRDGILNQSIEMIQRKPFLGYGLWGQYEELGTYPHNYYIEIMLHVGIPFGIVMIISFFYLIISAYFSRASENMKSIILLLSINTIFHGMVSGSYLDDQILFLLIGICLFAKRYSKVGDYY